MKIEVEYQDSKGNIAIQTHQLTRLALIKHMAIAGQGYKFSPQKLMRTLGMFLHYSSYINKYEFNDNRFSEPPIGLSDPTEKGQFSNLAGKAIADFLSKRIDKSIYTVNYEAAMRIKGQPVKGPRPDLIAFSRTKTFAIEAKGYAGNSGDMVAHKNQSGTGKIPVDFTVASVSYNLYNEVKVKYYDPLTGDIPYDSELLKKLTQDYYKGFLGFLDERYFNFNELELQGEKFYEIQLFPPYWDYHDKFMNICGHEILYYYRPALIVPKEIHEFAEQGLPYEIKPFVFERTEKNNIYIDNDRIGLKIR
jgi:hypothetical protein